jgi:hypothetical protein
MASKKSSRPKGSSPEEEKLPSKGVRKGPPPLPRPSKMPRHDTIEVDSRWLIPPLPKESHVRTGEQPRREAPLLPIPIIASKPRGKLPPPLPREDDDSGEAVAQKLPKRGSRTSRRPPSRK